MLNAIFLDDLGKYGQKVTKSDFQILKVIGRGSYGKVYLVNYIANNQVYAMKSIKKELIIKTDQVEGTKGKQHSRFHLTLLFSAERDILERLDHPFIMKL